MNASRAARPRQILYIGLGIVAGALLIAGCGGDDDSDDVSATAKSTTSAATAKTTTTASETETSGAKTTVTSAGPSAWSVNAQQYRGRNGEKFTIDCTPKGVPSSVWGVETYTDDSSICNAAVHVGLITIAKGGEVEYEIAPGLAEYEAGVANGVTSTRFAAYPGSYTFPAAPPGSGTFAVAPESWVRNAIEYRGKNGTQVTVECAAGGNLGSVYGTGTYTDDSSICSAAVHAGLITQAVGGSVTIEVAPGADAYVASTANGVASFSFAAFQGSFTFPNPQPS